MSRSHSRSPASSSLHESLLDWMDERHETRRHLVDRLLSRRMPRGNPWRHRAAFLAGVAFLFQVATGIALLFYFVPRPEAAQPSVRRIAESVDYGWFVLAAHAVGASMVLTLAVVHLLVTTMSGGYRKPRELVWIVLVLLVGILGAMAHSGSVLPWSDRSVAAAAVAGDLTAEVPLVGPILARWLLGGDAVGEATHARALAFHVALGPGLVLVLGWLYWRLMRSIGFEAPEVDDDGSRR